MRSVCPRLLASMLVIVAAACAGNAHAQCDCDSDLSSSGDVGFTDLTMLLQAWGPCAAPCGADLDGSGDVGFDDLTRLLQDWGLCPASIDSDADGVPDCDDQCPGADDALDSDTDGTPDCLDGCPDDPDKTDPGTCGCGTPDDDSDADGVPDCVDLCPGADDALDTDTDGTPDCLDGCPDDPDKTDPGTCGCGTPDDDSDADGVPDCVDLCPGADDALDTDTDGTPDCLDGCPDDPDKTDPGTCGCGTPDDDSDADGVPDCVDLCPGADDALDTDTDGTPDCLDGCPDDPDKTDPGTCGCGVAETPGCVVSAIVSDDFNRCALDDLVWTKVNPLGDATFDLVGTGTDDAYLEITVPPGVPHDAWMPENLSARAMQAATDGDFQIELKFDSLPTQKYQLQGVLIEQDEDTFIRVDFHSTGFSLNLFVATFTNDVANTRVNTAISSGQPLYLRVTRAGNDWTVEYGYDGQSWITGVTFNYAMTVTAIGPFGGSAGTTPSNPPGYTAQIDYFEHTANPLPTEDGPVAPGEDLFTLDTSTEGGSGAVLLDPDLPFYNCGDLVTLTSVPDQGFSFNGWSGDISSFENPVTIQITSDRSITANLLDNTVRAVISNVQVAPTDDSALITWETDIASDSAVDYGLTSGYELGTVSDGAFVTSHAVLLTGLVPEMPHHYQASSTNEGGITTTTVDLTFDTLPFGVNPFGVVSDDFNRFNIDGTRWTLVDALGDSTVFITDVNTDNAALNMVLPQGQHAGDTMVRLMQSANNVDFDARAKFLSTPNQQYQSQGILVAQDDQNHIRVKFLGNGSVTQVWAGSVVDGTQSTVFSGIVPTVSPQFLRVTRTGDDWELFYGLDGQSWSSVASLTRSMTSNSIGVFAANEGPSPAFTLIADYFEVMADPIAFEDGNTSVVNDTPPFIYHAEKMSLVSDDAPALRVMWDTDELSDSSVRYGVTPSYELGETSSASLTTSHQILLEGLDDLQTYELELRSTDSLGNTANFADTAFLDVVSGPVLDVWYGNYQRYGHVGLPQTWVNILGNVSDVDGIASLTYSLNGAPEIPLAIGGDLFRIWYPGDFNAEIAYADLIPGLNEVHICATDTFGNLSVSLVTVDYTSGNAWPIPFTIDWSTVTEIHDVAQPVDGKWVLEPDGVRTIEPAYDRLLGIGDIGWDNYEITTPVTVHSLDPENGFQPPSNGMGVGFAIRWTGHSADTYQPNRDYTPLGAIAWFQWRDSGFDVLRIGLPTPPAVSLFNAELNLNTRYIFKARVTTLSESGLPHYRLKYWVDGEPEPDWILEATGAPGDITGGSFALLAHHVDATFGNVTVVPVLPE